MQIQAQLSHVVCSRCLRSLSTAADARINSKAERRPPGYWKDPENQRNALDQLREELQVASLEDWYKVTQPQVFRKLPGLLKKYNNSLSQTLQAVFSDHHWDERRFTKKPNGFLRDQRNQRALLESAASQLSLNSLEAWYGVSAAQLKQAGLQSLLNNSYNGSLIAALRANFPDHTWLEWRFRVAPRGFWKAKANRRRLFDWIGSQLGIDPLRTLDAKNMEKWYHIHRKDVLDMGAASIIVEYYEDSFFNALLDLYPEHSWDATRFRRNQNSIFEPSEGGVDSAQRARELVDSLAKSLNVAQLDEWYRISASQRLRNRKGSQMTISSRSLAKLLQLAYPDHSWDVAKFSQRKKRSEQHALRSVLKKVYPNQKIIEEYSDTSLNFANSPGRFTLDLFLPDMKLAFEYQGKHHHKEVTSVGSVRSQQDRDAEKAAVCRAAGIKLVIVPDTWDNSEDALKELIG